MNIFVRDPFATDATPPVAIDGPRSNVVSIDFEMDRDFSLELAELQMVLEMKADSDCGRQPDGTRDFETVARSAALSSGNDFLFTFPAARFPVECDAAACLRIKASDATTFAYVYRVDGRFTVASEGELEQEFIEFAHSFATILMDLRDTLGAARAA